ncbi:membrane protein insertion efficiency factor YidD [Alphaproteobacteria bacterium]|nr:membrane protein insertion efficiency factor YidD [Alphaproteobacteria bacterium]MDC0394664.1 membrane protein insertion efficiency factor YidD [Alphaproteobacteria bacterium]MDC0462083.1 membrane protein insertion efficiency factor YidD [Alphaproteobacteria bacterium]
MTKSQPNIITFILIAPIIIYRWFISPILPIACRYQPTCSLYAIDAIKSRGPLQGTALAVKRIASCHPWGGQGYDPVPKKGHIDKKNSKTNSKISSKK